MVTKQRGFTLIELLVVIAIIGVLASIVLASLSTARNKGNDTKVKGELTSMRNAAEIYYSTNNNYGAIASNTSCTTAAAGNMGNDSASGFATLVLGTSYPGGVAPTCNTNAAAGAAASAWAAWHSLQAPQTAGNVFCVDSTGKAVEEAAPAAGSTAC